MKLSLAFTILISFTNIFLYSSDVNTRNLSQFSLILKKDENRQFSHQPLTILQERINFLSQYRSKLDPPNILFRDNSKTSNSSIVDFKDQINDFTARYEYAKVLSHSKETKEEALRQYIKLLHQKPRYAKLWLEVSRLYTGQGRFAEAAKILYALVYHQPLSLKFLTPSSHIISQKNESKKTLKSLIKRKDYISEDQARLELARILARHDKSLEEAIQQYQVLLHKKPNDAIIILELSRIYIKQKKYQTALFYLYEVLEKYPCHDDLLIEAAHAELGLAHGKKSHDLVLRALAVSKKKEAILMDEAAIYMLVGSFYKAEAIYQAALDKEPHSLDLALKLAWTLVSAQRYEEAEGLYRKLLLTYPCNLKILEALAVLKIIEKDFISAFDFIENILLIASQEPSYIQLKANALYQNQNYAQAIDEFDRLSRYPKFYLQALIGLGRTYRKLGQCEEATEVFQKAYEYDPFSIQAQFYHGGEEVSKNEFIQTIIQQTQEPQDLIEWANVYSDNGMGGVIEFYEAALAIDFDYFPAQTGMAEVLSANYKYDDALSIYLSILEDFPENSKMMIAIARVLSWGKRYENSMMWYDRVIALNPQDPLPRREQARVASWGKLFDLSMDLYERVLYPPVDQSLLEALQKLNRELCDQPDFIPILELLSQSVEKGSIYTGYETLSNQFIEISQDWNQQDKFEVEAILVDYLPLYRIQKSMALEREAKSLDWKNYSLHALSVYQELINFNPGNQEALYGYAQDFCNLGLCKCSRQLYSHMLNMDPNNNLVKMALERNLLREHPLFQGNYSYWTEQGSGQFSNSQIARHQLDEVFEWSPRCNQHFRFLQTEWIEYPFFNEKYYPAEGQTIEAEHVFNGYVKGIVSATHKNYFNEFPSLNSCLGTLWFNVYDYMQVGIGFEQKNEIYNLFTLEQGTQAKVYWASVQASMHSWNVGATYRHLDYNDSNTLEHISLLTTYAFTEDPNVFKLIVNASYRNAAHLTEIITNSTGEIIDVIHPYWTPENYYSAGVTLQFRHNYAWFNYCEAPQRYIDIKLTGEDDTAKNPSFQLAVNWRHEFMYHWGFEITALYHRSKLWNADGIWSNVYYRF